MGNQPGKTPLTGPMASIVEKLVSNEIKNPKGEEGETVSLLYKYQTALPTLPLPEFEITMTRFLETVQPFISESDFEITKQAVEEFRSSPEGSELHAALQKYAETQISYIEEFWYDAYLYQEEPLSINTNPMFILEDPPGKPDQITRATNICLSTLKVCREIRNETLLPDMIKNTPLSMDQYETIFGSARLPSAGRDIIKTDPKSTHIVVFSRGQAFFFDCIMEDGTIAITKDEFANNLRTIKEYSQKATDEDVAKHAVGAFTSTNRSTWAEYREKICNLSSKNQESIDIIDSSLFILCLDAYMPSNIDDNFRNTLHGTTNRDNGFETGTCLSRWFDKMQLVVAEDGTAGVVWEHSIWDGHSTLRVFSDVITDRVVDFAQQISGKKRVKSHFDHTPIDQGTLDAADLHMVPRKLRFEFDEDIQNKILDVSLSVSKTINKLAGKVLEFEVFGQNLIKGNGFSPDAFVQLAMLCTFYNIQGFLPNQYEAVMTKAFSHGRTEAGRAATFPALEWCKAFSNEDMDISEKLQLLSTACKAHSKMTRRCASGQGVDRYLYAAKCLWQKEHAGDASAKIPAIFETPGYKSLGVSLMSTSNCGNVALKAFGFGPVADEGVGVGYMIQEYGMVFSITSWTVDTNRFSDELTTYLTKVCKMMYQRHTENIQNNPDIASAEKPVGKKLAGETLR